MSTSLVHSFISFPSSCKKQIPYDADYYTKARRRMDLRVCNSCSSLSRRSKMYAVFVVTLQLVLSSAQVSSVKLPEQKCKPRPVVLSEETKGHRPYNILLYRCSGTCDETIPPNRKPCRPSTTNDIVLEVTDPMTGQQKPPITVQNHTSCICDCELDCNWENETPDEANCMCVKYPPNPGARGGRQDTDDVLPYKIGLFLMAFVTLCVLVFEMTMCAKRNNFLESFKESCCKSHNKEEHTDGGRDTAEVTSV